MFGDFLAKYYQYVGWTFFSVIAHMQLTLEMPYFILFQSSYVHM